MSEENRTRRSVLAGTGAIGVVGVAGLMAGCATYGAAPEAKNPPAQPGGGAPAAGKELAKTADVPVGGGKIFESDGIVVTQPEKDVFKAFSAACTHQGCPVTSVEGGTINCACHGSKFAVADGSVTQGPAPRGLDTARIAVADGVIKTA